MVKKFLLSFSVIVGFLIYSIHQKEEEQRTVVLPNVQKSESSLSGKSSNSQNTVLYKDGSYMGSVADALYGNIQVQAVIKNGKLTDVQFLQYPNDRETSIQINTQAMPYLKQEAIAAQNANVDVVSGATDTSIAFRQSLASALSKAK